MWDKIWEWPGNEAVNELVSTDWHTCSCVPLEGVHDRECDARPGLCARWVVPEGKLTMAADSFFSISCLLTSHHIQLAWFLPSSHPHHPHLPPSHPPTTLDHSFLPHTLTPPPTTLTPSQEWEDRDDDDIIVIERILLLLRNVLHITPDAQEEKVAECHVTCHVTLDN